MGPTLSAHFCEKVLFPETVFVLFICVCVCLYESVCYFQVFNWNFVGEECPAVCKNRRSFPFVCGRCKVFGKISNLLKST